MVQTGRLAHFLAELLKPQLSILSNTWFSILQPSFTPQIAWSKDKVSIMNREEMFALARGQSCSLTEMKAKHCIDSWDLFPGEEMHNFRMFVRLETTYLDQSLICVNYTCTVNTFCLLQSFSTDSHGVKYQLKFNSLNSGYLSGTAWMSSSGSRCYHWTTSSDKVGYPPWCLDTHCHTPSASYFHWWHCWTQHP